MQRRGDAALLGEQDVVGAAGGAGIHGVDDDAGLRAAPGAAPAAPAACAAAAEQQDLDAAMLA